MIARSSHVTLVTGHMTSFCVWYCWNNAKWVIADHTLEGSIESAV
jgi:hypothetical protein